MSKPRNKQPPGRSVDIASRVFEEYSEVVRRREEWATEHALREQLERLIRKEQR